MNISSKDLTVRVYFFGKTRDLSGVNEVTYQLSTEKIVAAKLLQQICKKFNLENVRDSLILAVNENYCEDLQSELLLKEGDELAIIPPISGFTRDALDIGKVSDMVSAECCGAISVFVGTTRDSFEGKKVMSLEYEAYEPMALKQLECVCEELRLQWPDIVNIAIYHRLGLVGIREASVMIAVSAPHRETSLKAVAVAIEDIKKRAPIWKKEMYIGGQATWKENKESSVSCSDALNLFSECTCQLEDSRSLPSQLVQISASEDEIDRRIQCFVEKKRNEIDLYNAVDFIDKGKNDPNKTCRERQSEKNETITCARINSIIVKQEYSKCHLKVRRVKNNIGPQIYPDYLSTLDKLLIPNEKVEPHLIFSKKESSEASNISKFPLIGERLKNIEEYINVPQSEIKNVYQRIKVIENRLLNLESISPEYSGFLVEKFQVTNPSDALLANNKIQETWLSRYHEKLYSIGEIGAIIQAYEKTNTDSLLK